MHELNADNLLLAEVWDMIDPLPDESEAPAPADRDLCAQCPHPIDANIHHKSTEPGYHEFKEAT